MNIVDPRIDPSLVPTGSKAIVIAEHQDEYENLPSVRTPHGYVITRWSPSPEERQLLAAGEDVFITLLSHGRINPLFATVGPVDWKTCPTNPEGGDICRDYPLGWHCPQCGSHSIEPAGECSSCCICGWRPAGAPVDEDVEPATAPTFNHTRGDSALTPCPVCLAAMNRLDQVAPVAVRIQADPEVRVAAEEIFRRGHPAASGNNLRGRINALVAAVEASVLRELGATYAEDVSVHALVKEIQNEVHERAGFDHDLNALIENRIQQVFVMAQARIGTLDLDKVFLEALTSGRSRCGHWSAYARTADGGTMTCLMCAMTVLTNFISDGVAQCPRCSSCAATAEQFVKDGRHQRRTVEADVIITELVSLGSWLERTFGLGGLSVKPTAAHLPEVVTVHDQILQRIADLSTLQPGDLQRHRALMRAALHTHVAQMESFGPATPDLALAKRLLERL